MVLYAEEPSYIIAVTTYRDAVVYCDVSITAKAVGRLSRLNVIVSALVAVLLVVVTIGACATSKPEIASAIVAGVIFTLFPVFKRMASASEVNALSEII